MEKSYLRLKSIKIKNFKNVKNGEISFLSRDSDRKVSILGLYGQNGSGKTAVIDVIELLRNILIGLPIPPKYGDFITKGETISSIFYSFYLIDSEKGNIISTISYSVSFEYKKNENLSSGDDNKIVFISKEKLSVMSEINGVNKKMSVTSENDNDSILKTSTSLSLLKTRKSEDKLNWLLKKKLLSSSSRSFIFSKELIGKLREMREKPTLNSDALLFISALERVEEYGNKELFVVNTASSNAVSFNTMVISLKDEKRAGIIVIPLDKPEVFSTFDVNIMRAFLSNMNIVLEELIPGLRIVMKEYGEETMKDGKSGVRIELLSERDGMQIPLRYESDGIKKIISVLQLLIFAYNSPNITVAIDELDSGVFEYLLGEIMKIISHEGSGQLIFTSHNLRPLETMNKDFIVFTTTNSLNRYVRMKNVKATNNLRDFYFRDILIGTQSEELYNFTNNSKISLAFAKAGDNI